MLEFIPNPWEVAETDFPAQGSPGEQLRFLLNYAVLATARIASISVRRPTLDDVFIKLTGREMREGEADVQEQLRGMIQRGMQ